MSTSRNINFLAGYIPVKNINRLQKMNLKVGDIVSLAGYYTSDDGANHYRKISKEDDGSGVLLNNGLYANIINNGIVNVLWFGANEKLEDNSQFIQKAINFSVKKCPVLIPCGTFKCRNLNIVRFTHLKGQGIRSKLQIIDNAIDNDCIMYEDDNSQSNVIYEDLHIVGNEKVKVKVNGIQNYKSTQENNNKKYNTVFKNIKISDFTNGIGLDLKNYLIEATFENILISDNFEGAILKNVVDSRIVNMTIFENSNNGIFINGTTIKAINIKCFMNGLSNNNSYGMKLSGIGHQFKNIEIQENYGNGLIMEKFSFGIFEGFLDSNNYKDYFNIYQAKLNNIDNSLIEIRYRIGGFAYTEEDFLKHNIVEKGGILIGTGTRSTYNISNNIPIAFISDTNISKRYPSNLIPFELNSYNMTNKYILGDYGELKTDINKLDFTTFSDKRLSDIYLQGEVSKTITPEKAIYKNIKLNNAINSETQLFTSTMTKNYINDLDFISLEITGKTNNRNLIITPFVLIYGISNEGKQFVSVLRNSNIAKPLNKENYEQTNLDVFTKITISGFIEKNLFSQIDKIEVGYAVNCINGTVDSNFEFSVKDFNFVNLNKKNILE